MHEFDTGNRNRRALKSLEPEHRTQTKFDGPMILFDQIIQIFRGAYLRPLATRMVAKDFPGRPMRSLITIECDLARQSALASEGPPEKRFGSRDIALGAEQEIDSLSLLIDGTVEISPADFNLDVGFVDAPGPTRFACEAVPALFEFRNIALDPAHDRRMGQSNSAFGHHFHEIPKAEFEPQVPPHAEDDDLPVEMAASKKIIYSRHAAQLRRVASLPENIHRLRSLDQNRVERFL